MLQALQFGSCPWDKWAAGLVVILTVLIVISYVSHRAWRKGCERNGTK